MTIYFISLQPYLFDTFSTRNSHILHIISEMSVDDGRVRVCLRVRPMLEFEKAAGYRSVVTYPQPNTLLIGQDRMFSFDYVKTEYAPQVSTSLRPIPSCFIRRKCRSIFSKCEIDSHQARATVTPTPSISSLRRLKYITTARSHWSTTSCRAITVPSSPTDKPEGKSLETTPTTCAPSTLTLYF